MKGVQFLVTKETRCGDCNGYGAVTHPVWQQNWDEIYAAEDHRDWFSAHGYSEIPPEEIACGACDGKGKYVEQVDLVDALRSLGVLSNLRE